MSRKTARTVRIDNPAARPARRVERKISLTAEADRRLLVHAACAGRRPSELVEELILAHLRRWVVQDRGGPDPASETDAVGRGGETSDASPGTSSAA